MTVSIVPAEAKCVFILDASLPAGLAANTAAVLGTALRDKVDCLTGRDVTDADGMCHAAITQVAFPMLTADADEIVRLHAQAREDAGLVVAGFTELAQRSRSYDDYAQAMAGTRSTELRYLGIALLGNRKKVASLTGHLALLR